LPRSHAVARLVELEAEAVRRRLDLRMDRLGAGAGLDGGPPDRPIEPADGVDRRAGKRPPRAHPDRARPPRGPAPLERWAGGGAEGLALAGREAPVTRMPAELAAVLVHDRPLARAEPVSLEECAVVVAGEEARFLALTSARDGKAGSLCLGARLLLRL